MLFCLLKYHLELYITGTAVKVSRSVYCFTTSMFHGVENYFPRLWSTGNSDAVFTQSFRYHISFTTEPSFTLFSPCESDVKLVLPQSTISHYFHSVDLDTLVLNKLLIQ